MAEQNLGKVTDAIIRLREENATQSREMISKQSSASESLGDIATLLREQLKMTQQGLLDSEESRRESKKGATDDKKEKEKGGIDRESFELKGVLQIVAGIGAAIAGFVAGFAAAITNGIKLMFSGVTTRVGNIVKGITTSIKESAIVKNISTRLKSIFAPVTRFIDALGDVFGKRGTGQFLKGSTYKTLGNLTKYVRSFADWTKRVSEGWRLVGQAAAGKVVQTIDKVRDAVRAFGASINNTLKSLRGVNKFGDLRAFAELKKVLNAKIVQPFTNFIKGVKGVGESTSKIGKTLGKFFSVFKVIGRFVAFPLTIVMGIIDAFKGFQSGQERQIGGFNKLIGGLGGAITGVLKGLVAMPLDLIKGAVSWIAGKLGFENFSKLLDSFSFGELFQKIGDSITDGFVKFFDGIVYVLKNAWAGLMKPFQDGFSFGAVAEFIITLPYKFNVAILDLVKNGVSALLSIFGQEDAAAWLDEFSFIDTFEGIIDFVKNLPKMFSEFITGVFSAEDPIAYLMEPINNLIENIKNFVLGLIPSMEDIKNLASGAISAVGDFLGFGESDEEKEDRLRKEVQEKMKSGMSQREAIAQVRDQERGIDTSSEEYQLKTKDRERRRQQQREATEVGVVDPNTMVDEKGDVYGDEFIDPVTGEKRRQRIFKSDQQAQAKVDKDTADFLAEMDALEAKPKRPDITPQTVRGNDLDTMSKENAQSGGATNVVVAAPQQQTVNNNSTQSTTAVMDQNLPTVDQNDRTYAYGG